MFGNVSQVRQEGNIEVPSRRRRISYTEAAPVPVHHDAPTRYSIICKTLQLNVKTLTGRTLCIRMAHSQKLVEDLKDQIEEVEGIPVHMQRLIWAGKQLEDGQMLAHYNIQNQCEIHLVQRLCGC